MKKLGISVIIAMIIMGIIVLGLLVLIRNDRSHPVPVNGVLDLSDWSFLYKGDVYLTGDWNYYNNQFLSPEEIMSGEIKPTGTIVIPSTNNSISNNSALSGKKFYGTMTLTVKLPDSEAVYGLRSDVVLSAFELYIDGVYAGGAGVIGVSKATSVPEYRTTYSYFSPHNNEVLIVYHMCDFHVNDSTIVAPRLNLAAEISSQSRYSLGQDMFMFGMLLIMGIYHLVLFTLRSKDKAPLYYGIFSLAFSLRMLLVGERFLPNNIDLGFAIYAKIAYITVFIGFSALCGFLYHTLDGLYNRWLEQGAMVSGTLFTVLVFLLPVDQYDHILIVYAAAGFSVMAYILIKLIYGVWQRRPYTNVVLLGFVCLVVTFLNDFIYQMTVVNKGVLIPVGISLFTIAQTYTLSARFSGAFSRIEDLSSENEKIMDELRHMNVNLESIVKKRTEDLESALKELEEMSRTDYLTQLPNRRYMVTLLEDLIEKGYPLTIAIVDVDHFKDVNDTYGHDKGDQVLMGISKIMKESLKPHEGVAGRWGGEEFLIAYMVNRKELVLGKTNELCRTIETSSNQGINEPVTVTIGVSVFRSGETMDQCIARADKALYEGKARGRNQSNMSI